MYSCSFITIIIIIIIVDVVVIMLNHLGLRSCPSVSLSPSAKLEEKYFLEMSLIQFANPLDNLFLK